MPTETRKLPINPKRIAMVRDLRMLDAEDWPDDMSGEKFGHFCMVSGFPVEFFRRGDPPEMKIHWCYTRDLEGDYLDEGAYTNAHWKTNQSRNYSLLAIWPQAHRGNARTAGGW